MEHMTGLCTYDGRRESLVWLSRLGKMKKWIGKLKFQQFIKHTRILENGKGLQKLEPNASQNAK